MDSAAARVTAPQAPPFEDGLGVRRQILDSTTQERLEVLCLRNELTGVPAFELGLRERVSRLANFRHTYYARARRIDRLTEHGSTLGIVSDATAGARLSDVLAAAEHRGLALDINAALCLIRQLVPAVATLHQNARDVAHGAIGPERIIVTPHARLVIADYVLGAGLEQLHLSHEQYWKELRVAVPRAAGPPRFDHRADVMQIGIVALSLILGRLLRDDEHPSRLADVVASASVMSALGGREPISPGLRAWLARALQIDRRYSFTSAVDAQAALDDVLSESGYIAAPVALEAFLTRFYGGMAPAPAAHPRSAVVADFQPAGPRVARAPQPVAPAGARLAPRPDVPRLVPPAAPPPSHGRPTVRPPPSDVRAVPPPAAATRPPAHADEVESIRWPVPAPPPVVPMPQPVALEREAAIEPRIEHVDDIAGVEHVEHELPRKNRRLVVAAAVLVAIVGVGVIGGARYFRAPAAIGASVGTLIVESNPPGAQVIIDGEARGVTPLNLSLRAGAHVLELHGSGEPRVIPLTVAAGSQVSQYIELPRVVVRPGQLQVRTDPAGAQITIDGEPRGLTPITIADLQPGEHDVLLESDLRSVRHTVRIEAGTTASLVVPLTAAAAAPTSGWVSVVAPVDVQLFEDGRLLGTSQSERIMVAAGQHTLEIVNETLGYRETRIVEVQPGGVATIAIELPQGTLALNASPWAEVWVDGERVGDTPIGNLPVTIGPHEVVFRHPELGEQRHAVTVTTSNPGRLSVDMRRP
jgi:hypothetical protein